MLRWDRVVIGNSLSAVSKARQINAKFILNKEVNFLPFTENQKEFDREYYALAIKGDCPGVATVDLINVDYERDEITIFIENVGLVKATYKNLFVFNSSKVSGLPFTIKNQIIENKVYDWFETNADRDNIYWEVEDTNSHFVKSVLFYGEIKDETGVLQSVLPGENKNIGNVFKRMVAVSSLPDSELSDINFSGPMARLKAIGMCKDAGITGVKNGYRGDKPKFKPLVVIHKQRQVVTIYDYEMTKYKNIIFDNGIENAR